jgi:hypothetical protein
MRTRARARPLARPLVCAALCLAVATGCGGRSPSDGPGADASAPSGTATPTDGSTPSGSGTGTATGEPAPTTPAPAGLKGRLLSAGALPGFNPGYRWREGPTTPESPSSSFGTCQRFAVTSIGAERVLVRRFRPAGPGAAADRAGEPVAQFPDPATARRAYAVLAAWRGRCADRLTERTRPRVGALQDVPVDGGTGGWYLLTYGPVPGDRDARFFDAQGMAVVGARIAMVSMVLAGQDYTYRAGREPMVQAVQRAAQLLG